MDHRRERVRDVVRLPSMRQTDEHDEARLAFDERRDGGLSTPAKYEIPFPVTRYHAIINFGRPIRESHQVDQLPGAGNTAVRTALHTTRAQMSCECGAQAAASLHIQRLIDRFV